MQKKSLKQFVLLFCFTLNIAWCNANSFIEKDGHSNIPVKEAHVQSVPKGSTIHASISGHYLTVAFTENLGQVQVEVTTATGSSVDCISTQTPNGVNVYIPLAGDYIVTFTLPNGDEYYGEFTVTD